MPDDNDNDSRATLVERLRSAHTDWHGDQIDDAAPPMDCLTAGDVRSAADEIERLRARALELEAQCEAGAASEQTWIDWLVAQGLLHYYPHCQRPDRSNGPAWVLRRAYMTDGGSCEAWHATSAAGALREFLRA